MLKALANNIGFDLVYTTNAEKHTAIRDFLHDWVANNMHGELHYLARDIDRRITPKAILPGAETVIMLAKNYYLDGGEKDGKRGKIANYARFRDYHKTIDGMFKTFLAELRARFPEHTHKSYVDYGPLCEKAFALKSGMGILGKNTTLISKEFGSWILLSEIITTVPEAEFKHVNPPRWRDNCGSCTKCLDACPTGALTKAYHMDARKCIAYLTIELKGSIPVELRPKMGAHLFGCDICQAVCPFNKRASVPVQTVWNPKLPAYMHPNEFLELRNNDEFVAKFAGTPLMRPKFQGMLRNASVVAGNLKLTECLPHLEYWQKEGNEMLAEHMTWAINCIVA